MTVYIPVPESNGEEWDRLPEESALSALVGVALEGEYVGVMGQAEPGKKETEALQFRSVAASVFEVRIFRSCRSVQEVVQTIERAELSLRERKIEVIAITRPRE